HELEVFVESLELGWIRTYPLGDLLLVGANDVLRIRVCDRRLAWNGLRRWRRDLRWDVLRLLLGRRSLPDGLRIGGNHTLRLLEPRLLALPVRDQTFKLDDQGRRLVRLGNEAIHDNRNTERRVQHERCGQSVSDRESGRPSHSQSRPAATSPAVG